MKVDFQFENQMVKWFYKITLSTLKKKDSNKFIFTRKYTFLVLV